MTRRELCLGCLERDVGVLDATLEIGHPVLLPIGLHRHARRHRRRRLQLVHALLQALDLALRALSCLERLGQLRRRPAASAAACLTHEATKAGANNHFLQQPHLFAEGALLALERGELERAAFALEVRFLAGEARESGRGGRIGAARGVGRRRGGAGSGGPGEPRARPIARRGPGSVGARTRRSRRRARHAAPAGGHERLARGPAYLAVLGRGCWALYHGGRRGGRDRGASDRRAALVGLGGRTSLAQGSFDARATCRARHGHCGRALAYEREAGADRLGWTKSSRG